mmetsp:Transcript_51563/g.131106  ORF Transcript_51563/g.131106 Transcript_51563/m.131106 type:complete len:306 (-) Transcript_51563:1115-2032(-)
MLCIALLVPVVHGAGLLLLGTVRLRLRLLGAGLAGLAGLAVVRLVLVLALLVELAEVAHELLEQGRYQVELLVFLVDEDLSLGLVLLQHVEGKLELLVDAHVAVVPGVQLELPLAGPAQHLESQLGLHKLVCVPHALHRYDLVAGGRLGEEEPPLLILGLREERRMHGARRLVFPEVGALHLHRHGGDVADDDLALVLHGDLRHHLHTAKVQGKGLDVQNLLGGQALKAFSFLRGLAQEARQRGGGILAAQAMSQNFLIEVRDLQELMGLHVEGLNQAPLEVDHGRGGVEPVARTRVLDHGLRDL